MLALPISALRAAFSVLKYPGNRKKAVGPTAEQFRFAFEKQLRNTATTEIIEMQGRGHSLVIDSGWQEVADTAPSFIGRSGVAGA